MAEELQSPLSVFSPHKQVAPDILARGSFYAYDPGLSAVVGAFTKEAFVGTGSMSEALRSSQVEWEKGELEITGPISLYTALEKKLSKATPSKNLTIDEWKQSEHFRPTLQYSEGMTETMAQILAEEADRLNTQAFIMSRASGLEKGIGITGAFIGGIFEPRNLGAGVGTALVLGGPHAAIAAHAKKTTDAYRAAKVAIKGAAKAKKQARRGKKALDVADMTLGKAVSVRRAVTEGFLGAAILEPGNFKNADTLQLDYGMGESLFNVLTSMGASGLIQGGVNYIGARIKASRGLRKGEAFDASIAAISQMSQGKDVNTSIVHEYYDSKAKHEKPPTEFAKEEIKQLAQYEGENSVHDYFLEEARRVRALLGEIAQVDTKSARSIEKFLNMDRGSVRSIKQVLIELGGVVDEGGELRARDIRAGRKGVPPGLIRRSAKDLHEAGEGDLSKAGTRLEDYIVELKERGFFTDKDADEITSDDILNLLEEDVSGNRQYPDEIARAIDEQLAPLLQNFEEFDKIGISIGDDDITIGSKLQQYYAENNRTASDAIPEIPKNLDDALGTPDDLLAAYERDYDEIKEIDLYDDTPIDQYDFEASQLNALDHELKDIDAENAELQIEVDEMKNAGLLTEQELDELEELAEYEATMDETNETIKAGVVCMLRG